MKKKFYWIVFIVILILVAIFVLLFSCSGCGTTGHPSMEYFKVKYCSILMMSPDGCDKVSTNSIVMGDWDSDMDQELDPGTNWDWDNPNSSDSQDNLAGLCYNYYNRKNESDCKKLCGCVDECIIKDPDPDGYLLKICEYLQEHKDTIILNKNPSEYNIKEFEEGEYQGKNVLVIRLDCCYMGDLAYIDKETKEVIGFSPGDI
ncbi:MAG: hypothetical protein GTN36_05115 [Candidatus Aenigmarchaeota archaeon]|nr:hypothetical protein [Candidatus Aenigmarchaeota archaeon]